MFANFFQGVRLHGVSTQNAFSSRLRRVVDRAGGVGAVAAAVGVSPGAVYGWLSGAQPYRRTILKLCAKLGISEDWLLDGNGEEEPGDGIKVGEPMPRIAHEAAARELADLSLEFDSVPPAYAASAMERLRDKFDEFMRRAVMHPARAEPLKYAAKPSKKSRP